MSKCGSCSYIKPFTLTGSNHRILAKFGGVLNAVEALRYKSPQDVRLLGDPLKSIRPECVVRMHSQVMVVEVLMYLLRPISLLQEIFRIPVAEMDRAYSEDIQALEK